MTKQRNSGSKIKIKNTDGKMGELVLIAPKATIEKFQKIANKSKYSVGALFEEMVDIYYQGINLD